MLASIGARSRPCTLAELLGAGDWINHAILTQGELESALGKLTGAGLVRIFDEWRFELTDDGLTLWSADGRDVQARIETVLEQLVDFEPGQVSIKLPHGLRDEALEEYRSR